jgi:integrase
VARRGKGEGSIYQLKSGPRSGLWRGYVHTGTDDEGHPIRKTFSGRTRPEVAAKIADALYQQKHGTLPAPSNESVAAYLTRWLEDVVRPTRRPQTHGLYAQVTRLYITPTIGTKRLSTLTAQDCQSVFARMRSRTPPISAGTQTLTRSVLIAALSQAVRWGLVSRNVASLTAPPHRDRAERPAWSAEEARAFLTAVRGHPQEALFVLALTMGLRKSEILALRWGDINFDRHTVRVAHSLYRKELGPTKTKGSAAVLPMPAVAEDALRRHRGDVLRIWGYVFCNAEGKPLPVRSVQRWYDAVVKEAGLRRIRFHDMRHTFGSLLLAQGVDISTVATLLRDRLDTVARVYLHTYAHSERGAADAMDALLKEG